MTFMGLIHKQVKTRTERGEHVAVRITANADTAHAYIEGKSSTDEIQYTKGLIIHDLLTGGGVMKKVTYQGQLTF